MAEVLERFKRNLCLQISPGSGIIIGMRRSQQQPDFPMTKLRGHSETHWRHGLVGSPGQSRDETGSRGTKTAIRDKVSRTGHNLSSAAGDMSTMESRGKPSQIQHSSNTGQVTEAEDHSAIFQDRPIDFTDISIFPHLTTNDQTE